MATMTACCSIDLSSSDDQIHVLHMCDSGCDRKNCSDQFSRIVMYTIAVQLKYLRQLHDLLSAAHGKRNSSREMKEIVGFAKGLVRNLCALLDPPPPTIPPSAVPPQEGETLRGLPSSSGAIGPAGISAVSRDAVAAVPADGRGGAGPARGSADERQAKAFRLAQAVLDTVLDLDGGQLEEDVGLEQPTAHHKVASGAHLHETTGQGGRGPMGGEAVREVESGVNTYRAALLFQDMYVLHAMNDHECAGFATYTFLLLIASVDCFC
jgi:hypothetical protein